MKEILAHPSWPTPPEDLLWLELFDPSIHLYCVDGKRSCYSTTPTVHLLTQMPVQHSYYGFLMEDLVVAHFTVTCHLLELTLNFVLDNVDKIIENVNRTFWHVSLSPPTQSAFGEKLKS